MAKRNDHGDRKGKSLEMKQRCLRLTDDENEMLNALIKEKGVTFRDLIVELLEQESNKLRKVKEG